MSQRSFEAAILQEAREVVGKRGLRQKDIQEWSTTEVKAQTGERAYRLPRNGVWVAIKNDALPKASQYRRVGIARLGVCLCAVHGGRWRWSAHRLEY